MSRYTWPITIVAAAIVLAGAGIGIALLTHRGAAAGPAAAGSRSATAPAASSRPASSPAATTPAPASSTPPPASASTSQAPPPPPASAFTVCENPVGASSTCPGQMKTEPGTILTSGDGSTYVQGITWTSWGSPTATGSGTMRVNNCTPSCAAGTYTNYPATVTVTSLTGYAAGEQGYATISISAPGAPAPANSYVFHNAVP